MFTTGTGSGGPSTPISYQQLWMLGLPLWESSFSLPFNLKIFEGWAGEGWKQKTIAHWLHALEHGGLWLKVVHLLRNRNGSVCM